MCGSNPPRFYFSLSLLPHIPVPPLHEEMISRKSSLLLCCTSNQSDARLYIEIFIDVYDNKLLDIKFLGYNLGIFISVHKY